jgi:hypothetical protein
VTLADLGLRPREDEDRRKVARAEGLKCPQCAGPLEVRAPDQTQRIACPWCGSLLDATRDFAILEALAKPPFRPLLPLGVKGRLRGVSWTVIGVMERSVTVEGVRYPWTEYLLYEPRHGFRWLVEAKRHWSFVEPSIPATSIPTPRPTAASGSAHFQSGEARSTPSWRVLLDGGAGEATETDDYVKPPRMLSKETTRGREGKGNRGEVNWSLGTYLPRTSCGPPSARRATPGAGRSRAPSALAVAESIGPSGRARLGRGRDLPRSSSSSAWPGARRCTASP